MAKKALIKYSKTAVFAVVIFGIVYMGLKWRNQSNSSLNILEENTLAKLDSPQTLAGKTHYVKSVESDSGVMPIYGHWRSFTSKDGLPGDKAYCVRINGNKVLVGTHEGLAVYEHGKWRTYTTKDGLAHNGVLSIDVSELTGDVWIGTMGGLTRWSAGNFENFTQFNSGLPNDIIYGIVCDGKDVWVATAGGAGHYDTFTKRWEIFTEQNAPMHEPWTYSVSVGGGKVFIAAWGGGVIEYTKKTKKFRDHTDPDG
jgi:hypothetical protein